MIPSGVTIGGKHTYTDFGMIPKSKVIFAPPIPKTTYIDVPGADGALDYSDVLTGNMAYQNRRGTINFIVLTQSDYLSVYSQLLAHFHGKELIAVLDDDEEYFYRGRFSINDWYSKEGLSTIAIDYDLEPYKYSFDTTSDEDWLWDDLFDTTIYYGTFSVNGSKVRNLINPSATSVTPKFICSSLMYVDFGGVTYMLQEGETTMPGFSLAKGDNIMTFRGNGNVLVDYTIGVIL